jgi:hypothetical protein
MCLRNFTNISGAKSKVLSRTISGMDQLGNPGENLVGRTCFRNLTVAQP